MAENEAPLVEIEEDRTQPAIPGPKEMVDAEKNAASAAEAEATQKALEVSTGQGGTQAVVEGSEQKESEITAPDATLATIQLKLSLGEDLSEEEKVIAAQIVQAPQAQPAVIKIGGKELTEADAEKQMRLDTKLGDSKIDPDALKGLIELWAKDRNKKEANRAIDTGYKENAQQREENQRAASALRESRIQLEQTAGSLMGQQQEILATIEELKTAAASTVTQDDLYDEYGKLKIPELNAFTAKNNAAVQLPKLEAKAADITTKISQAQRTLTLTRFKEIQALHPEYQTTEPPDAIVNKMRANDPTLKKEDRIKVRELSRLMDEADAQHLSFDDVLEDARLSGTVAIKSTAQSVRRSIPGIENLPDPTTLQAQIAAYRNNRKRSPSSAGTGAPSGAAPEKSLARQTIEHAHSIGMAGKTDDPILKEFKY